MICVMVFDKVMIYNLGLDLTGYFDQKYMLVNVAEACFLVQIWALRDRSACRVSVFHGDVWTLWIRPQDGSVL